MAGRERDLKDAIPFTNLKTNLGNQASSGSCESGNSGDSASSGSSACQSGAIGMSRVGERIKIPSPKSK